MKLSHLSDLGSQVALAASLLTACEQIPINNDAVTDASVNEAGMSVTDAGVPEIHAQIEGVKEALLEVMKTAHMTEPNYARHTGEIPLIDEAVVAGREEYNSSVEVSNFKLNDTEPGVYVRRYNPTDSTVTYNSMSAHVQTPLGENQTQYDMTISGYTAQIPAPSDDLSRQFDVTRKTYVGESYTSTAIRFIVHHGDLDAQDAAVTDAGIDNLDYVVDGCSYTYNSNLGPNNIPNNKVELPAGSEECTHAAVQVLSALNSLLAEHGVCSGVLDNLSTRSVNPDTCQ